MRWRGEKEVKEKEENEGATNGLDGSNQTGFSLRCCDLLNENRFRI